MGCKTTKHCSTMAAKASVLCCIGDTTTTTTVVELLQVVILMLLYYCTAPVVSVILSEVATHSIVERGNTTSFAWETRTTVQCDSMAHREILPVLQALDFKPLVHAGSCSSPLPVTKVRSAVRCRIPATLQTAYTRTKTPCERLRSCAKYDLEVKSK